MELTARLTSIQHSTPSVKTFTFFVSRGFTFLPGQWIDLWIEPPGEEPLIGGFTLVSPPSQSEYMELAIKGIGGGRAASFMHNKAKLGDLFHMEGPSGEFYFKEGMANSIVLIAGGIGINPFMSIIRYINDTNLDIKTTLIYSAKTPMELLFRQELEAIQRRNGRLRCYFTVSSPNAEPWTGNVGRIDETLLGTALPSKKSLVYVCGPPGMPTQIAEKLKGLGIGEQDILYEEWW